MERSPHPDPALAHRRQTPIDQLTCMVACMSRPGGRVIGWPGTAQQNRTMQGCADAK